MLKSTHLKMELHFFARLAAGGGEVTFLVGCGFSVSRTYVHAILQITKCFLCALNSNHSRMVRTVTLKF